MPQASISSFKGINNTQARLQTQPGEMVFTQNVRQRPTENLAKRRGIEPVSSSATPIYGIFDFDFDEIVVPFIQVGGTLKFYPNIESDTVPNPSPYRNSVLDPDGRYVLLAIECAMRAMAERWSVLSSASVSWPTSIYNYDGSVHTATSPGQYPPNNFYQYDLAWADELGYPADHSLVPVGSLKGTFAAYLVNQIRYYVDALITGASLVDGSNRQLDSTDVPSAATRLTYRSRLTDNKQAIMKMHRLAYATRYGDCYERSIGGEIVENTVNATYATTAWSATGDFYDAEGAFIGCSTNPGWVTFHSNKGKPYFYDQPTPTHDGRVYNLYAIASEISKALGSLSSVFPDGNLDTWYLVKTGTVGDGAPKADEFNDIVSLPNISGSLDGQESQYKLYARGVVEFSFTYNC